MAWQRFTPQHQLVVAIMGWPLFHLVKRDQDVFQWAALLQGVLLIYLLFLSSRQEGWRALKSGHLRWVWILFWCFVLYVTVVTLVHSPIFINGLVGYIKHVQFVPLLLVCSAIGLKRNLLCRWFIPYMLILIILLTLPLALPTVSESFFRDRSLYYVGPGVHHPDRPGVYVRYKFLFGSPNSLALFLACTMVFCFFSLATQLRQVRVTIPVFGILLLGAYLVFLTLSRRTWVILPVVFTLGIALQRGLRKRMWLIVGSGFLFVFILGLFREQIVKRLSNLFVFTAAGFHRTGPLHQRLILFEQLIGYFDRPIEWAFGLGAGTIGFAVRNYFGSGYGTVDGYYAILLGEYGLIGLLLYLALVLAVVSKLIQAILQRRLTPEHEGIVIASVTSSLVVLLAGWVGNANTTFPQALYLWAFLGIGLALLVEPEAITVMGSEAAVTR